MFKNHRFTAALLVGGLLFTAPACVAAQRYPYGNSYGSRDFERRAFDNGYQDGVVRGERDARRGRPFSYGRYRDDRDYRRGDGEHDRYRRSFRQGFERGYRDGFARISRGTWR